MNISGLSTDIFFIAAIKSNEGLIAKLPAQDIYNNVANPDIDLDNVELPYIVVNNDGGQNVVESKDDNYESDEDRVNISVLIVARNRKELDDIASQVRQTIHEYLMTIQDETSDVHDLAPMDYEFSFSDISYEIEKPSHSIKFFYLCEVANNLTVTNDE